MNCFFILLFLCVHVSLIAIRPTHLFVDTTRHTALLPIDPHYENQVLSACLQGKSDYVRELLQDRDKRTFSQDFFVYAKRALEASHRCHPNICCMVSSALSGLLAALFTQAVAPAGCPAACILIPFGGCAIGTTISGVPNILFYSQSGEELAAELNTYAQSSQPKAREVVSQHQPPPQLSMHTSQCQVAESQ